MSQEVCGLSSSLSLTANHDPGTPNHLLQATDHEPNTPDHSLLFRPIRFQNPFPVFLCTDK
jgi:hypothetical protein